MSGDPRKLFVYGSLLSTVGLPAHELLHPGTSFVATGSVAGRLYDTGDYPALVPAGSAHERVHGELYALDRGDPETLLARLDRFEGYIPEEPSASLFLRIRTEVALDTGECTPAWTYLYNRPAQGFSRIPSGDYAAHRRAG